MQFPMNSLLFTGCNILSDYCRSEGFALTGYDIPGRMEDGAWMLWKNSSVAVVVAAVAAAVAVAHLKNMLLTTFEKWVVDDLTNMKDTQLKIVYVIIK